MDGDTGGFMGGVDGIHLVLESGDFFRRFREGGLGRVMASCLACLRPVDILVGSPI